MERAGTGRVKTANRLHSNVRPVRAFSLVELVIVIVIIGIISAIAVPRFSRAAESAKADSVRATVAAVRRSMELYYAEHGRYPGYHPSTSAPDGDYFVRQLLDYSSESGDTKTTLATPYVYGPYVRGPFPANPFNNLRTVAVKAAPASPSPPVKSSGWVAVLSTGEFGLNAGDSQLDDMGVGAGDATVLAGGVSLGG